MSAQNIRLKKIEYSRAYKSENDSEIHLVGSTRWMRDIELLLEERWTKIKCYPDSTQAASAISDLHPKIVLIEPKAHGEDTSRWIESCVQNSVQALVIAPDSVNQFEWIQASRKAAAHNFGAALFSAESKVAAEEISNFLDTSDALSLNGWLTDVKTIQHAQIGYQLAMQESESLETEIFSLISDEFIIPSEDLAKGLALVGCTSLWKKPKATDGDLFRAYSRVEREIKDKEVFLLIETAISTVSSYNQNSLSNEHWNQILNDRGFGLLSKRRLRDKYDQVIILLQTASGQRILKIA